MASLEERREARRRRRAEQDDGLSDGSEANRDVIDRVNERLSRRRKEREEKRMLETTTENGPEEGESDLERRRRERREARLRESDAPAEEETSSRRNRRRQSEDEKPAEEAPAAEEEAPAEEEEDDSAAREAEERRRQQEEEEEEQRRQAAEERRRQEDERRRQKEEEEREEEEERRRQEECAFFDLIYGCDETESISNNQLDSEIIEKYETLDKTIAKRRNTLVQEGSIELTSDTSFSYQADTEGHCMDTDTADLTENEAYEYPRAKVSRILTNVRKIPQPICTSDTESYDLDTREKRYTRKVKSPHSDTGRDTPVIFYSDSENTDTMDDLEFDQTYTEKTFQNKQEADDKLTSASVKPEGVDIDDISEGSSVFIQEEESTSLEMNNNVSKTPTRLTSELPRAETECPVPRLDLDLDSKSKSSSESDSGAQIALGEGIGSRMKSVSNLLELDFDDGRTNSENTSEADSLSRKGSNSSSETKSNQDGADALSRKGSNSSSESNSNQTDCLNRKGNISSNCSRSKQNETDSLRKRGSNSINDSKSNHETEHSLIRKSSSSSIGTKLNSKMSSIYSDYQTDYCDQSPRSNQKQPPKTAPKPKQAPKPAPKPRKQLQAPDSSCYSPRGNLSPRKNGGYVPAVVTEETIQATNMCKYSPRKQIDKWKVPVSDSQSTKKSSTLSTSKINKIREQLTQTEVKLSPRLRPLSADRGRTFMEMKQREEDRKRKEAEEKKNKMNNSVLALIADRKKYFNIGSSYNDIEDHSLRDSLDNSKKVYPHRRDETQKIKDNSNRMKDNDSLNNSNTIYSSHRKGTQEPAKTSSGTMEDNSFRDIMDNSKRVSSHKRDDPPRYSQPNLKSSERIKVTIPHEPRISSPRVSGLRSDRSEPIVSPRGVPLRAVHDKSYEDIPSPRQSRSQYRSHGDSIREELRSQHNVVDIKGWREFKSEYGNYRRVSRVEFSSDSESEKPEKSHLRKSGKTSKNNDSNSLSGDQSLMKKISSFQNRILELDLDNSKYDSLNQSRSFLSESSSLYSPRYRSSSHDGRISYLKNKLETCFESTNTKPSSSRNSSVQRGENSQSVLDYPDTSYVKPVRDSSASRKNRLYTSTDYLTSNQKEKIDSSERQKKIDIKGMNRRLNSVNLDRVALQLMSTVKNRLNKFETILSPRSPRLESPRERGPMKVSRNSVEEVDGRRNLSNKENLQTHHRSSHIKPCNITPSRNSPLKSCDSVDGIFDTRNGRSRNFSTSSSISLHSESNMRSQARNSFNLCSSYLDTSNIRNSPGRFDRDAIKGNYSSLSRKDSGYDSSSISGGRNGCESPSISRRGIRNECGSPTPVRRSRYERCFDERNSYSGGNRRSSCGFESSTDDDFSHNGSFQRLLNDDLPSRRNGHFRLDTLRDSDESMSERSSSRPLSRSSSNGRMNELLQKFETLSQEISHPMKRSDSLGRFENRPISPSISMENLRQKFSCEDLSPRSDIFSQDNSRHYLRQSSRIY